MYNYLKKCVQYISSLSGSDTNVILEETVHIIDKKFQTYFPGEKYGYTRAIQFSFKDKENNTPLHAAVNGGCSSAIKVCLDAGAPPDVQQVRYHPNSFSSSSSEVLLTE